MKIISHIPLPELLLPFALGAIACLNLCAQPNGATPSRPPNVVVLFADDLGYADLGCQGSDIIDTPNIDQLARNGIRCTNAYMTAPQCSPSRAGLLTGRYQQRFGYEHIAPAKTEGGLPEDEIIIPAYLKEAGYHSGIIGKWHLGHLDSQRPDRRGFDEFYGFLGGGHDYYETREGEAPYFNKSPLVNGEELEDLDSYLTDKLAEEACDFIVRNQDSPFFLHVAFNAPHTPLQGPERLADSFEEIDNPNRREYLKMVVALDEAVGRIVSTVEACGLAQDTLIIFTNDNGGVIHRNKARGEASNVPLRDQKGSLHDGGIRVPWIWYLPGTLEPGVYEAPITGVDILPTLLELASLESADNLDGVSLWQNLQDGTPPDRDYLYWRFKFRGRIQGAVRKGDWKYYRVSRGEGPTPYRFVPGEYLYNLRDDIGEQRNLAQKQPEIFSELRAAYEAWDAELMEPAWPSD